MIPRTLKDVGKPIFPTSQILRIRFSPNGEQLVAACTDGTVRFWDTAGKEGATLRGHSGWVTTLAFAADGRLVTADSWGALTCWSKDAERKKLWSITAHEGWLRALAIREEEVATVSRDGTVRRSKLGNGELLNKTSLNADLYSVTYSHGSDELLIGDLFGKVHWLDTAGKRVRDFERNDFHLLDRIQDVGGIRGLTFSPDGKTLAISGAMPKTGGFVQAFPMLELVDAATQKTIWKWKGANDNEGYLHDLKWLDNDTLVGVTSGQPGQGKVLVWNAKTTEPALVHLKLPNCHSVDAAKQLLAVSSTNANSSGNGRGKAAEYRHNHSPISLLSLG
jgi:WD40 repeat protein